MGGIIGGIIGLAILGLFIATGWKIFEKAGKPGWAALVPIYNLIVMLDIAGKPTWWFVLFLIPGVSAIAAILVMLAVAQRFGKSSAFGLGLAFLGFIFGPMLAFSDAKYSAA
jgi:hypothetical protein